MTLVIGIQHPHWVAMTSDRMLSLCGVPKRRDAVKLIIYYADMVFGYTGYARLENASGRLVPTDEWIAQTLACVPTRSSFDAACALVNQLNEVFPRMAKHDRGFPGPHKIMGLGWIRSLGAGMDSQQPLLVEISNTKGPNWINLDRPSAEFTCLIDGKETLNTEPDGYSLLRGTWIGCAPDEAMGVWAFEELQKITSGDPDIAPTKALNLMKDLTRKVSRKLKGRYVGGDVMGAVLTRKMPCSDDVTILNPQSKMILFGSNNATVACEKERQVNGVYFHFPNRHDVGSYDAPHFIAPGFLSYGHEGGLGTKDSFEIRMRIKTCKDSCGDAGGLILPSIAKLTGKGYRTLGGKKLKRRR